MIYIIFYISMAMLQLIGATAFLWYERDSAPEVNEYFGAAAACFVWPIIIPIVLGLLLGEWFRRRAGKK